MDVLLLEAVIEKSDIMPVSTHRGDLNSRDVTIGDLTYAPTALVFCGFEGRLNMEDRLYHGHYCFRVSQQRDADRDTFDVSRLPQKGAVQPKAQPSPESEPVTDEKESVNDGI